MSYDPKVGKWSELSIAIFVKNVVDPLGITFFIEGVSKEIESAFTTDSAVLRITGPSFWEGSGESVYKFEVLVLFTDFHGKNDSGWDLSTRAGVMAQALSTVIPVYRHGDEDPASLVGCLQRDRDSREFVKTVQYGIIQKDANVKQTGVLAKYELCL